MENNEKIELPVVTKARKLVAEKPELTEEVIMDFVKDLREAGEASIASGWTADVVGGDSFGFMQAWCVTQLWTPLLFATHKHISTLAVDVVSGRRNDPEFIKNQEVIRQRRRETTTVTRDAAGNYEIILGHDEKK